MVGYWENGMRKNPTIFLGLLLACFLYAIPYCIMQLSLLCNFNLICPVTICLSIFLNRMKDVSSSIDPLGFKINFGLTADKLAADKADKHILNRQ